MKRLLITSVLASLQFSCSAGPSSNPEAVGTVAWGRDPDAALTSSGDTGKPVFALFQEVPGCAGCRQFGREVLSDPLVVEAIQSEFIPLLIHNNSSGGDSGVLKRFGEPAWNYQVVRFLDTRGKDVIPRRERVWETGPLTERMIDALARAGRPAPLYLKLIAAEHSPSLKKAAFAMDCFWTGEMKLGRIDGVVTTEAGFINGQEVTLAGYDPVLIPLPRLIAAAEKVECARAVYVPGPELPDFQTTRLLVGSLSGYRKAPANDQKKQLSNFGSTKPGLTPAQAAKVNSWIGQDRAKALAHLSPRQRAALRAQP
ncbi:MAG: hypothetical protein EOP86_08565 [Verrucomicrobiaceae bacterium]|nr:MAG: hypothetical protein EOP86_08565 [Verrucomicrobiaceae bacterium]